MDGHGGTSDRQGVAEELRARLSAPGRLGDAVRTILDHTFSVLQQLQPAADELDAVVQFLTDVGYATDARRQEWVLLADVFGLSDWVARRDAAANSGATPATLPGPFYRPDAPRLPLGADLCRNGEGTPLAVTGRVMTVDGAALPGAEVEVWHANGSGRYENQDPDSQPEHNLRGRFLTDADGRFHFRTVRPGGYSLPDDGPVGTLARRLGLSLDRPAHIHFAVTASGCRRLVTAIFDGADPAIGRDALFAVRPGLIGDIRPAGPGHALDVRLILDRATTTDPTD